MKTTLAKLAAARGRTPEGYVDAILAAGQYDPDGVHHHLAPAQLTAIRIRFGIMTAPAPRGLGDHVAAVAQPIAKLIDKVAGTNLQNCGGCKKRQEKLNTAFPTKPTTQNP